MNCGIWYNEDDEEDDDNNDNNGDVDEDGDGYDDDYGDDDDNDDDDDRHWSTKAKVAKCEGCSLPLPPSSSHTLLNIISSQLAKIPK